MATVRPAEQGDLPGILDTDRQSGRIPLATAALAAALADPNRLVVVAESGGELVFVGERVPLGGGVGAGLRESDTALRDQLDAAITAMKADGSLNAMLAKWFPNEVAEEVPAYAAE